MTSGLNGRCSTLSYLGVSFTYAYRIQSPGPTPTCGLRLLDGGEGRILTFDLRALARRSIF